jgi:transposase
MQTIESIGIDIAKDKFDVGFVWKNKTPKVATFGNNVEGIGKFISYLKQQGTSDDVPCVLESTGIYHLPVALMVTNAGFRVNCINPLITKKYQRSSVRNAKTDSIDALRLADVGLKESNLPIFKADIDAIEQKKLVSFLNKLEVLKSQIQASTKAVIEMNAVTGLKIDLAPTHKAIRSLNEQIKNLKREIIRRVPEQTLKLSDDTPGISREKLAALYAIIGDKQFSSRDQIVAFVGLDVMPRESGTWRGRGRLSKRGNGYARKILFQMAWGLKQHNENYKKRYEELKKNGKDYRTRLIILARSFLRFLYAKLWKKSVVI